MRERDDVNFYVTMRACKTPEGREKSIGLSITGSGPNPPPLKFFAGPMCLVEKEFENNVVAQSCVAVAD